MPQQEMTDKNRNKAASRPVVKARDGCLRGRTLRSEAGTVYYAFKGVPYARPPVGDLRFRAPQPPEPWTDVRDAGHEGNVCAQPVVKSIKIHPRSWAIKDMSAFMAIMPTLIRRAGKMLRQSEDCLYLNVFTPELPRAERAEPAPLRPVMFWIHGGGFLVGDGDGDVFGPEYFLDMGIVVVTINYRLGAFGFLSVGTEAAPGNAGLKDQSMALRWVRDNITVFGGDPNRVTIFGESAGAVSAHMHTLSPLSRGLFHGVIACSGSALNEWALTSRQLFKARELAKVLGIEVTDPADLVDALRRQSADRITHGTLKMCSLERFVANELAFMPVVEPAGKDAFLCEDPALILREGRQADVPVILGVNDREGLLWFIGNAPAGRHNPHSASEMAALERRCAEELFLSDEVHAALTPEQRVECHNEIMQFYFGDRGLSKETLPQFVDLFGDLCFVNSLIVATKAHAAANKNAPVYAYYMCFEGRLGFFKRLMKLYKYPGVSHGDELGYLFRIGILPEIQLGPESKDLLIRKRMLKLWYNFITTGNPTPDEDDADLGVTWTPTGRSSTCMDYLEFGDSLRMRQDPPSERVLFWDGLYRKYMGRSIMS